jgi:hypothetical protein
MYVSDQTAVYVDGPHHHYPERQQRDQDQTACMEDRGYSVVRFRVRDDWEAIVRSWPSVFGALSSGQGAQQSPAPPAFAAALFPPEWREVLHGLAGDGVSVEPGRDVMNGSVVEGPTVARVMREGVTLDVIDTRHPAAKAVARTLQNQGLSVIALDPTAGDAASQLRTALRNAP